MTDLIIPRLQREDQDRGGCGQVRRAFPRVPSRWILVTLFSLVALVPAASRAADRYKTNNNDNLDLSTSWTNGAPGSTELAVWDATVAASANCTNNLGTAKTWGGIKILNPAAPVKLGSSTSSTLSLGGSGINLNDSNTTQDLWLGLAVTTTQPQTWAIKTNRTLIVGETNTTVTIGANVTVNGYVRFPNIMNVQAGAALTVPDGATIEPTLAVAGATLNVGANSVGGNVNQTGGTVKINRTDGSSGSPKGAMIIASSGSATAAYNLTGGALLDTTPANASTVIIGNGTSANGTLNVSGTGLVQVVGLRLANASAATGTINLTNGSISVMGGTFDVGRTTSSTPGPGTVNLYGGSLSSVSSMNLPHGNGPGYFNLYGGIALLPGGINLPDAGAAGAGTVNLNGGTLSVSAIAHPGTNTGTLVLNGGTLTPTGNSLSFIASAITVNVGTSGGRIDTAGFGITIPAALLNGTGGGADGGLTKLGAGTLTLVGASTYNGSTVVSNGTLLVNNSAGSGTGTGSMTVGTNATLGGTGTIAGMVAVNPGGTLAPGAPVGTLTLSNSPALNGTVAMGISKAGLVLSNDKLVVAGHPVTFSGTLTVIATGDPLTGGDTFDLFDATGFNGDFTATNLPSLLPNLSWDLSRLKVDGTIKVAGAATDVHPQFNPVLMQNRTTLVLSGTGGFSNGTYYVLSSTDVTLPLADWTLIGSSLFDAQGRFSFTNAVNPALSAQYFALSLSAPVLSPSDSEILAMLANIRDNGYDGATNVNGGLGGLWINWRYGTSPLQANFNGSGFPDGSAVDPPREDELTDLRYLHNLLWYKSRRPLDTQFDPDIQRYSGILRYEFTGSQNERGWIYDEEFLPMWWLSGDNFFLTNALGQAAYFANSLFKTNINAYYKTSSTHTNGYYRVDWEVEIGCALVMAGTTFTNADWVAKGHQMVQFAYDHAYLTNYHLFLQQMDNVLLPDGSLNPNQTIYLDGDTDGGVVRFGSNGQEALSLLHVYQVTSNQLYLNRAMDLLDPLTVQSNLFGLWDTTYGGYFTGLDFPGPTFQSPGVPALNNTKKEAGRQITMLQAFHVANAVTTNRYAATEAALLNVALQKAYYAPGHGVLYEVADDWTPLTYSGQLGDWVTTEAMGIVMEALFSLGQPNPW